MRILLACMLMAGRLLWASATSLSSRQLAEDGPTQETMEFFDASISYMILLPGAIEYSIPVVDYTFYFVSIVNELATELTPQVFDPSSKILVGRNVTMIHGNEDFSSSGTQISWSVADNTTMETNVGYQSGGKVLPIPTVTPDLPTKIDEIQEFGFSDTPNVTDQGIFIQGPCPSSLGNGERDRCVEVTASIRLDLSPPTGPRVTEALKAAMEDALEKAVMAGRLDEVLLESFPWTDLVVLSGYHASAYVTGAPINATTSAPSQEDNNTKMNIFDIVAIVCGNVLLLALVFLVTVCLIRRKQETNKMAAKEAAVMSTMQQKPAPRGREPATPTPEIPSMYPPVPSEPATGLEWGHGRASDHIQLQVIDIPITIETQKNRREEWLESPSVTSQESDRQRSSSMYSRFSRMSSMSSMISTMSSIRGGLSRYPSGTPDDLGEHAFKDEPGYGIDVIPPTSPTARSSSTSNDDDDDYSRSTSTSYESSAVSMQPSVCSSVPTVNILYGAQVVSSRELQSQVSPMDVRDLDALEAAILVGDWEAVLGSETTKIEASGPGKDDASARSFTTLESASVYKESNRYGALGSGVALSRIDDGDVVPNPVRRTTEWEEVIDAANASEMA